MNKMNKMMYSSDFDALDADLKAFSSISVFHGCIHLGVKNAMLRTHNMAYS